MIHPYSNIEEGDFVTCLEPFSPLVMIVETIDGDVAFCTDGDGNEYNHALYTLEKR